MHLITNKNKPRSFQTAFSASEIKGADFYVSSVLLKSHLAYKIRANSTYLTVQVVFIDIIFMENQLQVLANCIHINRF